MGGSHSTCTKHIYEEINDKQFEQTNSGRFDRRESTATLDVKAEDLAKNGRRGYEQAFGEWGSDDRNNGWDEEPDWFINSGWGNQDIRRKRSRKRGAISNVTFYENIENHIYDDESITEGNDEDDFEIEKTAENKTVKYKRCKSIDIKVLDVKDGESIEF